MDVLRQLVEANIAKIGDQLAQVDANKIPDSQSYLTRKWVKTIEELAGPQEPLRNARGVDAA
jgi:hypothetical protein